MKLRPNQEEALSKIITELTEKKKALAYLSVGFGKTILMAKMCEMAKGSILITVPKITLINQTVGKLEHFVNDDDIGVYCGSLNRKELDKRFVVSTLQSIIKSNQHFNFVIIDEAHLMKSSILKTIEQVKPKYVLGMTGTPFLKGNIYGENQYWDEPCVTVTLKELTKQKYLSPLVLKSSSKESTIDLTGISIVGIDYNLGELETKYSELVDEQVKDALIKSADRKAVLWMCVSIEHAGMVYRRVSNSKLIHSRMSGSEDVIDSFRRGEFKNLISVAKISVGFDAPVADCLVLMRATKSPALFIQTVGRILRLNDDKKDGLLLDYGCVCSNLGHPYSVTSGAPAKSGSMKICPICEEILSVSANKCSCGYQFLISCMHCGDLKPMGEACECGHQAEQVANLDSLTAESYDDGSGWHKITGMRVLKHTAKSGDLCARVMYFSGLNCVVSEYYKDKSSWHLKKFMGFIKANTKIESNELTVCDTDIDVINMDIKTNGIALKEVYMVKNGKYKKIQSRKYY